MRNPNKQILDTLKKELKAMVAVGPKKRAAAFSGFPSKDFYRYLLICITSNHQL